MPKADDYSLRVTAPGEAAAVVVNAGEAKAWPSAKDISCAVIHPARPPSDREAHLALIAWRPSELERGERQESPAGDWKLEVLPAQGKEPVHFYVCRNQLNPGALPRATQGAFVDTDETYDPLRSIRYSRTDASNPQSPIRRQGGMTTLSTLEAPGVVVVGGYINREGDTSLYSSDGPAAGGSPPRCGPDQNAPADESFALPGIRAAASRSGDTVRVRGTSFAAPQIARLIADRSLQRAVRAGKGESPATDLEQWLGSFSEQSRAGRRRQKP
jgi:hypothetical protein